MSKAQKAALNATLSQRGDLTDPYSQKAKFKNRFTKIKQAMQIPAYIRKRPRLVIKAPFLPNMSLDIS